MSGFLSPERYANGPWHYFERATARLLMHKGWDNVEIVGRTGDKGADIIGLFDSEEYVIQVKWTAYNTKLSVVPSVSKSIWSIAVIVSKFNSADSMKRK